MNYIKTSIGSLQELQVFFKLRMAGLLVSATVAMAATFLSIHYAAPVMLFALLLGMAFNFLAVEGRCAVGIEFCSKRVLQLGVALLGARITWGQIYELGFVSIAGIGVAIGATLLFGLLCARFLGFSKSFAVLTAGAVAICGASAAMAISSVLPQRESMERDTIFTVICVTTLSTLAMILYPMIAALLGLDRHQTGLFLGATIHDVAQVVGAGYGVSGETGDIATMIKLARVALLVPLVMAIMVATNIVAPAAAQPGASSKLPLPWFLIAFLCIVSLNSTDLFGESLRQALVRGSQAFLVMAIAALGMKTSLKSLAGVGRNAIAMVVAETLFLAGVVLLLLYL
jgi:uncharacterized integral membrane protein (TIGR00698 family)